MQPECNLFVGKRTPVGSYSEPLESSQQFHNLFLQDLIYADENSSLIKERISRTVQMIKYC
jgi:hypothetical protein